MPAVFARGTRCGLLCGVRLQRAGYCPAKAPENTGSAGYCRQMEQPKLGVEDEACDKDRTDVVGNDK